ncbi:MAG: rhodanese-like domain-containing protein [Candidatus Thioglobus sp.]|nr:rhodanese-like domain-containing protein [Candidatus Thioglobus sp.]
MNDYQKLVAKALATVGEIMPWDLAAEIAKNPALILLDIRQKDEFEMMHISNSINAPRGILEGACCWNYDDTIPILAAARDQNIVTICRSGNRSVLAAKSMQDMGFASVRSLKLGIKGWNDNDLEMLDLHGNKVDIDTADEWLNQPVAKEKLDPIN